MEKINETKSCFLENNKKIDKPLARPDRTNKQTNLYKPKAKKKVGTLLLTLQK